jgi:hypothetical protein
MPVGPKGSLAQQVDSLDLLCYNTFLTGADMKRTDVEELLQQMEQFADYLFAQGKTGAGNELWGAIETADAVLEDCELED